MKRLLLLALCLVATLTRADQPVLRWACDPDSNAPYSFYGPNNKLTGFEYEIIHAVAKQMGRQPKFVQTTGTASSPASAAAFTTA